MNASALQETAKAMVTPGKGILAMDESAPTIHKRFQKLGIEDSADNRRAWRELLLTTAGLADHISAAILYDETVRQTLSDGTPFPEHLRKIGILPGIKVDAGAKDLAGFPGEKVTEGLDGLRERLAEYKKMGARFAKWRAVIAIGPGIPSHACIQANAHALARYAALCQEAGLVPIVEPEVLIDGDHTLERCYDVSRATLRRVFSELAMQQVDFGGMILKASMVLSGKSCPQRAGVPQVAEATVRCLLNTVPAAVTGVAFLSGGQTPVEASAHLNAMNAAYKNLPWRLSFSYARALQDPAMQAWKGSTANVAAAQKLLAHRARLNGAATLGQYTAEMEKASA